MGTAVCTAAVISYTSDLFKHSDSGKEVFYMAGKKGEVTSSSVASKAGKLLSNPKTSAAVKSVAASALTQRPGKKK